LTSPNIAVVMPAYNEAEGLPSFLAEIVEALAPEVGLLHFVVVDDRSTDDTTGALGGLDLGHPVQVISNERNRGHGPSALRAYRAGLETGAELVLHVDGDGQFAGRDLVRVLRVLDEHDDGVHGIRVNRSDPWFRRLLSRLLRTVMVSGGRATALDINTPLRLYRRAPLERLLAETGPDSLVPHVHFSYLEPRLGLAIAAVVVESIPRRGADPTGTTWGRTRRIPLPSRRLVRFVASAGAEVMRSRFAPRPLRGRR
jgi:dolichol-phosphate mannosyltransferase